MDQGVKGALHKASTLCDDECEEEAERVILGALEKHPRDPDLRAMLGTIQSRLHREEEAEITLRGVLQENPLHEDATCALGRLLDQSLRTDEAEQIYRNLLKKSPDSHCALDDLSRMLLADGRNLEALEIARKQIQRYPTQLESYDGLRYVLAVIEDELCGGYISESTSNETIERLAVNLLEQYDVISKIEQNIGSLSSLPENVSFDLQNEYLRIVGELEHLLGIIDSRAIEILQSIIDQLEAAVLEGKSRREKT